MIPINEPIWIASRKDYATGEVAFEGFIVDNKTVDMKIFLTFKHLVDAEKMKELIKLGKNYNITLSEVEIGKPAA